MVELVRGVEKEEHTRALARLASPGRAGRGGANGRGRTTCA
jgi:hypothetical protein